MRCNLSQDDHTDRWEYLLISFAIFYVASLSLLENSQASCTYIDNISMLAKTLTSKTVPQNRFSKDTQCFEMNPSWKHLVEINFQPVHEWPLQLQEHIIMMHADCSTTNPPPTYTMFRSQWAQPWRPGFILGMVYIISPVWHTCIVRYNSQTASSAEAQASPFHLSPFERS